MDSIDKLKADLIAELNVQYKNLVSFLQNSPIPQKFKDHGFMNLDQGMRWMLDGIQLMQVQTGSPSLLADNNPVENPEIPKENLN